MSWSKDASRTVAEEFAKWLPRVIQECEPFISSDTSKGDRWFDTIETNLAEARVGVLFLTPENADAPWLNYEAGALRTLQSGNMKRLCAVFVGMKTADYDGPIKNFQMTDFSDKADMLKLMESINEAAERPLESRMLEQEFGEKWERLRVSTADAVDVARKSLPKPTAAPSRRTQDDKLDEVLDLLRELRFADARVPHLTARDKRSLDRKQLDADRRQFDADIASALASGNYSAAAGLYLLDPKGVNQGQVIEMIARDNGVVSVRTDTGYRQESHVDLLRFTEAPF
uniref:Toll/interleukin-1 receptor domain-containing protein n=1 Tax=Neobacillus citreus TaxID=2833578 RepID=A0A942T1Q4_9BACI